MDAPPRTTTHVVDPLPKRPEVSAEIREAIGGRLARHGLVVDEFSIINFAFSESFDHAIEAKTVAEQHKPKAERDLERIKLAAEAQAQVLRIQCESITPELIELRRVEAQLRAIEKWDGCLPNVNSGVMPFISVQPPENPR